MEQNGIKRNEEILIISHKIESIQAKVESHDSKILDIEKKILLVEQKLGSTESSIQMQLSEIKQSINNLQSEYKNLTSKLSDTVSKLSETIKTEIDKNLANMDNYNNTHFERLDKEISELKGILTKLIFAVLATFGGIITQLFLKLLNSLNQ